MQLLDAFLVLLGSRSFGTIWFWIVLAVVWTTAARNVLGVPPDIFRRVPRQGAADDDPASLALLDWLSMTLPRWRIGNREGVWLLGIVTFLATVLVLLGFGYGLEMAQALVFLLLPVILVMVLGIRLARHLRPLLARAQSGAIGAGQAATEAANRMRRHRFVLTVVSAFAVVVTAFWGAMWIVMHPFGY